MCVCVAVTHGRREECGISVLTACTHIRVHMWQSLPFACVSPQTTTFVQETVKVKSNPEQATNAQRRR